MNAEQKLDGENINIELLKPLQIEDIDEAIELANRSYPEKVKGRVTASLLKQQQYMLAGLDNGARQFKMEIDGKIAGVCGLYKRGIDVQKMLFGAIGSLLILLKEIRR